MDSSRLSGDLMPFNHRDLAFANPNFKILLHAGETVNVWIYMDQSGLFLRPRLRLWTMDAFVGYASQRQLIAGLILGLFSLSNLVFFLAALFRILPIAKWYAGFIGIQTLLIAIQLGIAHQYFWPESGRWSTLLAVVLPLPVDRKGTSNLPPGSRRKNRVRNSGEIVCQQTHRSYAPKEPDGQTRAAFNRRFCALFGGYWLVRGISG